MTVSRPAREHHRPGLGRGKRSPAEALLAWYDTNRRTLAWRAAPGKKQIPYRVWLSEIMLQQTTVQAVDRYYRAFIKRWPNVSALAEASLDEVLSAWAGLGYYSRARNLHRAAQIIAHDHKGRFPRTALELKKLPGVGTYTAAAIASIAFDERVAAIDANGERVLARLFALEEPLAKTRKRMAALADALVPVERPGDFAQALMDLGSAVCTPKRPICVSCPFSDHCLALARGIAEQLPLKGSAKARPTKRGAAFIAFDRSGAVLLERRPEKGLLGSMLQPPLGVWGSVFPEGSEAIKEAPFAGDWFRVPGVVRHSFTHFHLEVEVYVGRFARRPKYDGVWTAREALGRSALPTVMKKLIHHALDDEGTS